MTELTPIVADQLRILVFEDNAMDAAIIKKFLKTAGVRGTHIYHADTIPSALQVLSEGQIDLCVTDYHLPQYTGIDLMDEARRSDLNVPFIVVTAIDDRSVDEEALAHGAYDFLVKGDLTVESLDRSVRYAIASHRREKALSHAAYFDPLTRLPNRLSFLEHLTQAIRDNSGTSGLVGVALMNLNGTKLLNTRLGHDAGDEVLRTAAARLEAHQSKAQFVARVGGDEFAVLMNNLLLPSHALAAAKTITDSITGPIDLDEGQYVITATCGVSVHEAKPADDEAEVAQRLLLNASHAMFDAKVAGRRTNMSNVALGRVH